MNVAAELAAFQAAGVETIALRPGSKIAAGRCWSPAVRADCNYGVRLGGGLAVIDCDTPGLQARVVGWLEAIQYPAGLVRTPSGGLHVYIRVSGVPEGFNYSKIGGEKEGGRDPGELRAGAGAYVVGPGSIVAGRQYELISGSLIQLPELDWDALAWLRGEGSGQEKRERPAGVRWPAGPAAALPIPLIRRAAPERAEALFTALRGAQKGARVLDQYRTRSEAEAALVAVLVLAGWSFENVSAEFTRRQPAHFAEHPARRSYLRRMYSKTVEFLARDPARLQAAELYRAADNAPWPGRGGAVDRAVLLGLLAHAWQFGALEVSVSERDLALYSAASRRAVQQALGRLHAAGLIERTAPATCRKAATFRINSEMPISSHKRRVGGWGKVPPELRGVFSNRPGALGQAALLVWRCLGPDPVSVAEIAERTGKHPATVRRILAHLSAGGRRLAARVGRSGWRIGPDGLQDAAGELQAGVLAGEAALFALQRSAWRARHADCRGECEPGGATLQDKVHQDQARPAVPQGLLNRRALRVKSYRPADLADGVLHHCPKCGGGWATELVHGVGFVCKACLSELLAILEGEGVATYARRVRAGPVGASGRGVRQSEVLPW